jgi:hypothetical protein
VAENMAGIPGMDSTATGEWGTASVMTRSSPPAGSRATTVATRNDPGYWENPKERPAQQDAEEHRCGAVGMGIPGPMESTSS